MPLPLLGSDENIMRREGGASSRTITGCGAYGKDGICPPGSGREARRRVERENQADGESDDEARAIPILSGPSPSTPQQEGRAARPSSRSRPESFPTDFRT